MDFREQPTAREVADSYLTNDEVNAVLKPLEQASVLPLRVYSSKTFFEREVDAVLRPSWHAVAHVHQLRETGSFVTADIVGEPVIVVRDKDGKIAAFSNVCRHRGAQLLNGCGVAKAIVCPYHTWAYNLDGTLRGAPHMNKIEGFDRKSIRLAPFATEVWNGFVFVNLDPDAEPLAPQVAGLEQTVAPFEFAKWESVPWQTRQADWNWKASLENFSEAYHHVGVHRESIGKVSPAENARYVESNDNYSLFSVNIEHPDDEYIASAEYPFVSHPGLPEEFRTHAPLANIYPTFHLLMNTNFVLWLRIEVQDVNSHRLIWTWLLPPGSSALPDFPKRMEFLSQLLAPVVEEDLAFLPRTRVAATSRTYIPGRYCDQERCVHQMQRWIIRKMSERNSLTAPPAAEAK